MESRSRGQQRFIADGSGNEGAESGEDVGDGRRDGAGVLILNPVSGGGDHGERVRELASDHGFEVRETDEEGDGVDLAAEAASEGVDVLVAAGGDGTVNEVVRGLYEADALGDPVVGIVPAGTGNNFAGNVGIEGIEHAFEAIEAGEVREIDVALANDRPFVNSCVGGLTANASSETTVEAKDTFGVLAYVIETFQAMTSFEKMRLHVEARGSEESWSGDAVCVLIGNGRRFPVEGEGQGDVEDGAVDVTLIEQRPTARLVGETAARRLLDTETSNIDRLSASKLDLDVMGDQPVTFSLDGEMLSTNELHIEVRPRVLSLIVGEAYDPKPTVD
jgi:YegS/Rv2252/BmrU family lipid kinase